MNPKRPITHLKAPRTAISFFRI